jgi:hypothetical protein
MKKRFIVISVIVVIAFGMVFIWNYVSTSNVKEFNLKDYELEMKDKTLYNSLKREVFFGIIDNPKTAKEKAEEVFVEVDREMANKAKPYKVFFDSEFDVWLVRGSFPPNQRGGIPYIVFQKSDGKVLGIWESS